MTQQPSKNCHQDVTVSNTSSSTITFSSVEYSIGHPFDYMTTEQIREKVLPLVLRIKEIGDIEGYNSIRDFERLAGLDVCEIEEIFFDPITPETPRCTPVLAALIWVVARRPKFMLSCLRRLWETSSQDFDKMVFPQPRYRVLRGKR